MAEAAPNVVNLLADSPKVIRDSLHGIGPISAANIITLRAEGKLCLKALENACGTIVINDNAQEENNDAGTENVNVATGRVAHPRTSTPRFQPMRSSRKSRYSKKSNLRNKSSKSKFRSSKQKYTESSGSDTSSEITCEERITYSSSSSSDE